MPFDTAIALLEQQGFLKKRTTKTKRKSRFSPEYLAYMRSQAWQDKRQQVLKRDRNQCQVCNTTQGLQVHHRTYDNCNKLGFGNEPLEDLITLCKTCHDAVTVSIRKQRKKR